MMPTRIRSGVRATIPLTILAAAVLLVAGCTSPSGSDDPGTVNEPPPSSDGGGGGDTGIPAELPATFPASVPLIDGEVAAGIDVGTGWSVIILADDIDAAFADATAQLTGAGFVEDYNQSGDDGSFAQYQSDEFTVQVTGADQPDYGPSITYLVVIK